MEYFYTFLIPLVFEFNSKKYVCWGYHEVDGEVVCFNATLTPEEKWTNPTYFTDKELVEKFKTCLPEQPVKKKRKK